MIQCAEQEKDVFFEFIEFNPRRKFRGANAVRMKVNKDGSWLWMNVQDLELNIRDFGSHPELLKGLEAYGVKVQ